MTKLDWNTPGLKKYETGVDRAVLYRFVTGQPQPTRGYAWPGVVSIEEAPSGGEVESYHFDGIKYLDVVMAEDYQATLEAFAAPDAFDACDGTVGVGAGVYVTHQPRVTFGLCYRTGIGNDLLGEDYGYKLHLVYNATAAPTTRQHRTRSDDVAADTRSWSISTVPPASTQFKPTAHFIIDSTKANAGTLATLETALYGTATWDAYLPPQNVVMAVLAGAPL